MKSVSIGEGQPWASFWLSRARNSDVKSLIPPKFELIQEFMAAPVTCKFDEDRIIIEGTIDQTMSIMGFLPLKGK